MCRFVSSVFAIVSILGNNTSQRAKSKGPNWKLYQRKFVYIMHTCRIQNVPKWINQMSYLDNMYKHKMCFSSTFIHQLSLAWIKPRNNTCQREGSSSVSLQVYSHYSYKGHWPSDIKEKYYRLAIGLRLSTYVKLVYFCEFLWYAPLSFYLVKV